MPQDVCFRNKNSSALRPMLHKLPPLTSSWTSLFPIGNIFRFSSYFSKIEREFKFKKFTRTFSVQLVNQQWTMTEYSNVKWNHELLFEGLRWNCTQNYAAVLSSSSSHQFILVKLETKRRQTSFRIRTQKCVSNFLIKRLRVINK